MRPSVKTWLEVIGVIAAVIGAIAATVQLVDRWRSGATPPGSIPPPTPTVEGTPPEVVSAPLEETGEAGASTPPGDGVGLKPKSAAPKVEQLINEGVVPSSGSVPVMAIALDGVVTNNIPAPVKGSRTGGGLLVSEQEFGNYFTERALGYAK